MKKGQLAGILARFYPVPPGDCLSESSITLNGKVESPDFIFRFSKISAYDPSLRPVHTLQELNPVPEEGPSPPAYRPEALQQPTPVPAENYKPPASQSEAPPAPTPASAAAPVANPGLPVQPTTVAEICQQAMALWNQKRYSDALHLFNQACIGGVANSCYYLGLMYEFGQARSRIPPGRRHSIPSLVILATAQLASTLVWCRNTSLAALYATPLR